MFDTLLGVTSCSELVNYIIGNDLDALLLLILIDVLNLLGFI